MTDTPEIPPAIPADVWNYALPTLPLNRHSAEMLHRWHFVTLPEAEGVKRGSLLQYRGQQLPTAEYHAVAALCLYGQSFGFTQEEVDAFESMMRYDATPEETALCKRAVAKIAALLPPARP